MTLDEIIENFELLDDTEDQYSYLIELGRELEPLSEAAHSEANKVRGCISQVWLESEVGQGDDGQSRMHLRGDSDALIVRGLITVVIAMFSDRTPAEIAAIDPKATFERIGLAQHLTRQRSNGTRAVIDRIKAEAERIA